MSAVVIEFPTATVLAAHAIVRDARLHSHEAIAIAATLLVHSLLEGHSTPPGTSDRVVWLALGGPAPMDLRRRLADQLSRLPDDERRVRGRALVQLRDPKTPRDQREIARRLLGVEAEARTR